ncbi:MAG: hypothetical protein JW741_02960, partial [Sedimentisphaerales bacterium]|nr:hypothetical protein [Sedimentisphaerales bacterium]
MRTFAWTTPRSRQRGIALLTVVALLSFFAVVGTAFTFTMRLEEQTARNFQRTTRVHDAALIGTEVAAAALRRDLLGPDGLPGSGDEFSYFDSEQDGWFMGYAGRVDLNAHFMARGHLSAVDPRTIGLPTLRTAGVSDITSLLAQGVPNRLYRLGLDGDPPGDLNGDGAPGIAEVDDDGDGWADFEDPDVLASIELARVDPAFDYDPAADDDEDGRMDEDSRDGVSAGGIVTALPVGQGLDADGDRTGVEDESAKLNLNAVGNLSGGRPDVRYHRHHQGVTTFEIDPVLYFIARGVSVPHAVTLGRNLVLYRNGTRPGTVAPHNRVPGLDGPSGPVSIGDDNGNNNPEIIVVDQFGRVSGDGMDNDHDGFTDEPDEAFIGNNWNEPVTRLDGLLMYGDGIDNDGDGLIDESGTMANPLDPLRGADGLGYDEGVNDPLEFNAQRPRADDKPFDTLEELRLVEGFDDVVDSNPWTGEDWTIYDYVSGYLTVFSSAPAVNPLFGQESAQGPLNVNRLSSYTPDEYRLNVLDLLALFQVDNDGDWDPALDDFNANGRPDGDWDGHGRDTTGDGVLDTDGDFNQDGLIAYDPEYHVNEDPPGDLNGDGAPGIEGVDDDLDGASDLNDPDVARAIDPARRVDIDDRRDNDWNNPVWLRDGLDNDFDGRIDETREDELAAGVSPALARDEGIDETLANTDNLPFALSGFAPGEFSSLEKYYPAFDDDEDGRMDEDPPEFDFLVHLADSIDLPKLRREGTNLAQGDDVTLLPVLRYNPREVADAPNDFGLPELQPDNLRETMNYSGSEGIYINEVMVRPVIVLQAEFAQFVRPNYPADEMDYLPDGTDTHWEIPPGGSGDYYIVYNAYPDPLPPGFNPQDEIGQWTFPAIDLPAVTSREYDIWFYPKDLNGNQVGEVLVEAFDGTSWIGTQSGTSFPVSFNDPAGPPHASIDLPNGASQLRITITVADNVSGVASFDRIELFNPDIQYVELVNLTPRQVDMSNYELEVRWPDGKDRIAINDSAIVPGALAGYTLAPYNPDEEGEAKNLLLLAYKALGGQLDKAYALPGGAFSSIPNGITYLENDNFELFTETTYQKITEAEDPARADEPPVLELYDPVGNLMDSFTLDYRVRTPNNCGFLAQQRADVPTEGKFEKVGDVYLKKADPRRLDLWNADAVIAKDAAGNTVDVFGVDRYYDLYWEDNPNYPGRLAFKFGETETDAIDEVNFAFNLSRRFANLDYELGGGKYYLDVFVNAPPWSNNNELGIMPLPLGTGEEDALPWPVPVGTDFFVPVQSGALWRTVEVFEPGENLPADLQTDTWLMVTVSPPKGEFGVLITGWENLRIESVDLADHGLQDRSNPTTGVLELRGGSPGRPSSQPPAQKPLVRNGSLPSPGAIADVAASGPQWVLSASDVVRLAGRFTTHERTYWGENGLEVPGLINLNTAPASVLCALPWLPPRF